MKRYLYAKIPGHSADVLGEVVKHRKRTLSGEVIINESDLLLYGNAEDSFEDKVKQLSGVPLTNIEAKQELQKKE